MSYLSNIFIFLTISSLMLSISMLFRNAENGKLTSEKRKNSVVLLVFSITVGLFIIMLANF